MLRLNRFTYIAVVCSVTLFAAVANSRVASAQAKKAKSNPLAQIEDDPKLPGVLLIGDSISIGYTLAVRDLLKGKANVHRPPTNCGPTSKGLAGIDQWLGENKWDVIHFNWGLHDLKYVGASDKLVPIDAEGAHQQIELEQYERNLKKLVQRLKATGAELIWRSTTPVPPGARGRTVGDSARYNAVAAKIMQENNIAIDDMFSYSKAMKGIQRPKDVHYTPEGSKKLAAKVAEAIEAKLP